MNVSFDPFRFETATGRLWCGMQEVRLTPKAAAVLGELVVNAGEPVSKENLFATVWAGRVVSDDALTSCIQELRRALEDEPKQPRYIETRHRRGYRFVARVSRPPAPAADRANAADRATDRIGRPMVVVLPFDNISGDPERECLSGALTQDIIAALSRFRSLQVIARGPALALQPRFANERRVGLNHGAGYVVGGNIGKFGTCLRIRVHLIETGTGRYLWAEQFDRGISSMAQAHDEITAAIAARIEPEIGREERVRVSRKPEATMRAWDCFNLGMHHFHASTADGNREAQRHFTRAIEMDRTLAQAHSWLSCSRVASMIDHDVTPSQRGLDEAVAIARQGVELDEQDGLTHFMLGRALLANRACDDALLELKAGVVLNPNLSVAHHGLGEWLANQGRFDEAVSCFDRALELNPFDSQRGAFLAGRALTHLLGQEFEQALEWSHRAVRVPGCRFWTFAHRVSALAHLGRREELPSAMADLLGRKPDFSCSQARDRLLHIHDPDHVTIYLQGLRIAGIRE